MMLSQPPMVFIGLISYSLYLWHWPLLVFIHYWRPEPSSAFHRACFLVFSMALAVLSWKLVETPFRKKVAFPTQAQILSFGCLTTGVLLLAGLLVYELQGLPLRIPPQALAYAKSSEDYGSHDMVSLGDAEAGKFIELGNQNSNAPIKILLWGDSHAMATVSIFRALCVEHGVRGVAAVHQGTAPILGMVADAEGSLGADSVAYNRLVVNFVASHHVENVVLVAHWHAYGGDLEAFRRCLAETLEALKNSGTHIWIMLGVPVPGHDVPRGVALDVLLHGVSSTNLTFSSARYEVERARQDKLFMGISEPDLTFIDPVKQFLAPNHRMLVADDKRCFYVDQSHLSTAGAKRLQPVIEPIFSQETSPHSQSAIP
jgi:hypothetical protein